jgi:hypothetical protein
VRYFDIKLYLIYNRNMTNHFKDFRFKNIFYVFYESIEFVFGFFFILFFGFFLEYFNEILHLNINLRTSLLAKIYEYILDQLTQYNWLDSGRVDIVWVNYVFMFLILDILHISITRRSVFDLVFWIKYEVIEPKNTQKLKMVLYAIIKCFAITLWIFSWKVDSVFFVIYSTLFYLYFPLNLIVRIATKSKQSIIFCLLNLKNI